MPALLIEDVEPAERADGVGHHLAAGGLVGDVDLEHGRLDAELGELGRGGLRLLHVASGDGDRRAGFRHAPRHAEPDAAVAAGDDRDAALEIE